jgi:hypothetical protein
LTGGGFAENGAWSVGFNAQFGAAAKSYFKNFSQSAHATFSPEGIHIATIQVSRLVYGGANITAADPDETGESNRLFQKQIGEFYVKLAQQPKEEWTDVEVFA